ncbi:MAG: hypothetical protein K8L99_14505 [Anaerolineae bacterium]|nr:hypothetical protein [Anaerolineae bacterium]
MNATSTRGMLMVFGIVIVALIVLAVVGNLLSQILPLTIALVIGIALGRLSASVNLVDAIRRIFRRTSAAARRPAKTVEQQPTVTATKVEKSARRIADEPAAEEKPEITDFVVKSDEEVLAEARQRESELKNQQADADAVRAALEERRRRLLGEDSDT